jgi:hypothetical protein
MSPVIGPASSSRACWPRKRARSWHMVAVTASLRFSRLSVAMSSARGAISAMASTGVRGRGAHHRRFPRRVQHHRELVWHGSTRHGLCMSGSMDALSEAHQHDDIVDQSADQLNASMERVRQARQLLFDESDRLTQTRQDFEKDARIERVRRAGELLQVAHQQLARTRQQVEQDPRLDATDPAMDDASMKARHTA